MVIMRSTMLHRGGLYRFEGCKIGDKVTKAGRMTLHFAVENNIHVSIRQNIAKETIECAKSGIKWTERNDAELEKLSIL